VNPEVSAQVHSATSRRNFILLLTGAAVFGFGWAMPNVTRVPFINWLGMSNRVYGLIGAAWGLCLIGNFLCPWLSRRYPRKKWFQFLMMMPYIASDLLLGVCVLVAMWSGSSAWLMPATIALLIFWPFAAGWTLVPQSEFIANCIPKSDIGKFVSLQQTLAGLMGLLGSAAITGVMAKVGVPSRYAVAFLVAYAIALTACIIPLFARETPSPSPPPEPFWKPAWQAVRHDSRFRRMLGAAMILWLVALFPSQFMLLLAVREWGSPDWYASAAVTAQSAAMMGGAALAGFLGQKFTYGRAVLICNLALPLSLLMGAWPLSSEFRADTFTGQYSIRDGHFFISSHSASKAAPESGNSFRVLKLEGGPQLIIVFSSKVDPATFTANDLVIQNGAGRRLEASSVIMDGTDARRWTVSLPPEARNDGDHFRLAVQPYVCDAQGRMLDQNDNGRSPWDAYRIIALAAFWGLAFSGLGVGLETLMYQFSPADRRAGYFSAFRLVQFTAPTISFFLSGLTFKAGQFAVVFQGLLVAWVVAWLIGRRLLISDRGKQVESG
jgi:MFS family permease